MTRRRVQDGQAQGELARVGESHDTAAGAAYESNGVEVHIAENIPQSRKAVERAPAPVSASMHSPQPAERFAVLGGKTVSERVEEIRTQQAPETISVTWGEELFTPVQFCSFRVGPFSASTTLRVGESREQAADRLMRELERIAAKERELKTRVYKDSLGPILGKKVS